MAVTAETFHLFASGTGKFRLRATYFCPWRAEKFRVSGREVLLPVAADVFFFFASGGPISFNSERNGGKNAGKNCVFAFPCALWAVET